MGFANCGGLWSPGGLEVRGAIAVAVVAVLYRSYHSSVCLVRSMDQLRSQVKQEDVRVKEGLFSPRLCRVRVWTDPLEVIAQVQSTCHRPTQPRASEESLVS